MVFVEGLRWQDNDKITKKEIKKVKEFEKGNYAYLPDDE